MEIRNRFSRPGVYKTREYNIWAHMIKRCNKPYNKDYKRYGGRGINVSKRWMKFNNFLKDMGWAPTPSHSLDRINNELGYTKSNCRWATPIEQARNRRDNIYFTINGETKIIYEWIEQYKINYKTVYNRIYVLNWRPEDAITKPAAKRSKK